MKIETFEHNTNKDGTIKGKGRGAVITEGAIRIYKGHGCGLKGCHCSDGYGISIIAPRDKKGKVKGVKVSFKNLKEMKENLNFNGGK